MSDEQVRAAQRIAATVVSWPEVEVGPHCFGGVEFRVGRRELGHLYGGRIADLPFPRRVRDGLTSTGHARVHHVLPGSGCVTASIGDADGVERAIALFRLSYERARRARGSQGTATIGTHPGV